MAKAENVLQTPTFKKVVKKLNTRQKEALDISVKALVKEPALGERKKGNFAFYACINLR